MSSPVVPAGILGSCLTVWVCKTVCSSANGPLKKRQPEKTMSNRNGSKISIYPIYFNSWQRIPRNKHGYKCTLISWNSCAILVFDITRCRDSGVRQTTTTTTLVIYGFRHTDRINRNMVDEYNKPPLNIILGFFPDQIYSFQNICDVINSPFLNLKCLRCHI